jgi:hypothetical protein
MFTKSTSICAAFSFAWRDGVEMMRIIKDGVETMRKRRWGEGEWSEEYTARKREI